MKLIVNHETLGKVLFDTETQEYEYVEPLNCKFFTYKGKSEKYFDNVASFLESNDNIGIVPVLCAANKVKGKRTFIEVIDHANYNYIFFNVEMINSRWVTNYISGMVTNKCYFIILKRNREATNDCILMSSLLIVKGMHNTPLS